MCMCMCIYSTHVGVCVCMHVFNKGKRAESAQLSGAPTWRCGSDVLLLEDQSFYVPAVLPFNVSHRNLYY